MNKNLIIGILSTAIFTAYSQSSFAVQDDWIPIQTIWLEASGDGLGTHSMQAVAEVIRNRAKLEHSSWASVCMRRYQFSCYNKSEQAKTAKRLAWLTGHEYQRASEAWSISEESNITHGANSYCNLELCHPKWADKAKLVAKVGKHSFFRL